MDSVEDIYSRGHQFMGSAAPSSASAHTITTPRPAAAGTRADVFGLAQPLTLERLKYLLPARKVKPYVPFLQSSMNVFLNLIPHDLYF